MADDNERLKRVEQLKNRVIVEAYGGLVEQANEALILLLQAHAEPLLARCRLLEAERDKAQAEAMILSRGAQPITDEMLDALEEAKQQGREEGLEDARAVAVVVAARYVRTDDPHGFTPKPSEMQVALDIAKWIGRLIDETEAVQQA